MSGLIAVLVALADQGLTTALLALLIVVVVQQAEGNLLEPLILSPVLRLPPFLWLDGRRREGGPVTRAGAAGAAGAQVSRTAAASAAARRSPSRSAA